MKFTSTVAAIALVVGASAQQAIVHNNCQDTVYVQSFPYDGSATGPLTTLQAGQTFSEDFRKSGSTVKVSKTKTLTSPLFIGYSFSSNPDYGYYELSSEWGNRTSFLILSSPRITTPNVVSVLTRKTY